MLKKKPKNLGRGLKSWGIVENGLYFENIKKKKQKNYYKGIKTAVAEKRYRLFAQYRLLAPTVDSSFH